ncbi:Translation initiation factor IF-3 [Alteracholeplasma palmae J233]|uniref:Translation initiation factor IF-3 n=1 Tax=Alteracholeplasma palmae (strain ATCC 49389 / J233) TaxID=1318466 RepID=U4KRP2_ALTPJ|nr:translation initiation factor IF-3 [Alteracholeplasma palmae]CCV64346.1 Translation initiation factor IF-3 [Alteracholeplasma palmae J233]
MKNNKTNNTDLYNDGIPTGQYLVIDEQGEKLGTFNREQALKLADEKEIDIVVVSPGSKPMVARLMDYSKYRYEQQKKSREMKKNQQVVQLKEIRLSPTIDTNDLNTKVKQATKFLEKGDKVKVSMRFRGRMITHHEIGRNIFNKVIEALKDLSTVEAAPKLEGNQMVAILAPSKQ